MIILELCKIKLNLVLWNKVILDGICTYVLRDFIVLSLPLLSLSGAFKRHYFVGLLVKCVEAYNFTQIPFIIDIQGQGRYIEISLLLLLWVKFLTILSAMFEENRNTAIMAIRNNIKNIKIVGNKPEIHSF